MEGGTRCKTAVPSTKHAGAATKECDVCTCSETGISNGLAQQTVGCGNHNQDGNFYCYVGVLFPSPCSLRPCKPATKACRLSSRLRRLLRCTHPCTRRRTCVTHRCICTQTSQTSTSDCAGRKFVQRCDSIGMGRLSPLRPLRLYSRLEKRRDEGLIQWLCEPRRSCAAGPAVVLCGGWHFM